MKDYLPLPESFLLRIQNAFKEEGTRWLEQLPALVKFISSKWNLSEIRPVSNLSYNFVAYARQNDTDVILKIGVPRDELNSEITALRLFNGDGTCRLLESDEERGASLLERLKPGQMLSELADDVHATEIAADVMMKLWRPAPNDPVFIKLADWFDGFNELRDRFDGGTGPLDGKLVTRAQGIARELLSQKHDSVLMHGDFHHYNVLSSKRGWLAIDPKGVIGPGGYEVGPLLINPLNQSLDGNSFKVKTEKRVSILSERLGMSREEILNWGIAHAVLSAWWSVEEGAGWEYAMGCANIFISCL